jgi:hypothetical protein
MSEKNYIARDASPSKAQRPPPALPKRDSENSPPVGQFKLLFAFATGIAVGVALCLALYLIWSPRALPGPHSQTAGVEHNEPFTIGRNSTPAKASHSPPAAAPAKKASASPAPNDFAAGETLSLLPVTIEEQPDDQFIKHFFLHVPIKARPNTRIDVSELVMHILFYDIVDGQKVVQTSASVNFHWNSPPANWTKKEVEELVVDYQLPKPKAGAATREDRKFYGYIVRIYYRQQLQASTAMPDRLRQQYPPPQSLPK